MKMSFAVHFRGIAQMENNGSPEWAPAMHIDVGCGRFDLSRWQLTELTQNAYKTPILSRILL